MQSEDTPWSPGSRSSSQKAVQKIQSMHHLAAEAAAASAALAQQSPEERSKILHSVAAAMEARKDEIAIANSLDIASFRAQSMSPRPRTCMVSSSLLYAGGVGAHCCASREPTIGTGRCETVCVRVQM